MDEGRKLVVMARFIPELNDIQELLEKKGIGYSLIRGGVKDRAEEIRRFQEDEDCRVFVGQIAAAGLGINIYLIAKNTVDRKVLRSLREKRDLAKLLVDDYRKGKNPFKD